MVLPKPTPHPARSATVNLSQILRRTKQERIPAPSLPLSSEVCVSGWVDHEIPRDSAHG